MREKLDIERAWHPSVASLKALCLEGGATWVSVRETVDYPFLIFIFMTTWVTVDGAPDWHFERIAMQLQQARPAGLRVVPVWLPDRALPKSWPWETFRGPESWRERLLCWWDLLRRRVPRTWATMVEVELR